MAGTRLLIHTTFVIELFSLIITSLFYASTKTNHHEPFFIDQSGWEHVIETVSPINHGNHVLDRIIHASHDAWMKLDRLLLGKDAFTKEIIDVRLPSAFVDEMKRAVSSDDGEVWPFPPLTIEMSVPQLASNSTLHDLAMALERALQKKSPLWSVSVSEGGMPPDTSSSSSSFCDEWTLPYTDKNRHEVKQLQLIILTGCSSGFSSGSDEKAILQMSKEDPILVLRTRHNAALTDDLYGNLHPLLEGDVASILSHIFDTSPSPTHPTRTLTSLSIEMIDENPTLRSRVVGKEGSAKAQVEYLGEMFDSLVKSMVQPLLKDFSSVYGGERGRQRRNVPDGLSTHLSSYLPLPEEMIQSEPDKPGEDGRITDYISTEEVSKWVNKQWNPNPFMNARTLSEEDLQWVFFVPSPDHTPLMIRDDSTGDVGSSITFSLSDLVSKETGRDTLVSGLSIVNLDPGSYPGVNGEFSWQQPMQPSFENATAAEFVHLIGYIRAFHGLSPVSYNYAIKSTRAVSVTCCIEPLTSTTLSLSFWEKESIARNHWNSILEQVLYETDALMSLLHTHGNSLAFPEEVAHTLNNATHLLRHSIALAQQGYPAMYSTPALYDALHFIEAVRTHPELMELPHFALDHYLAVFSPLVLPLLMPMIVGLVREFKRFKKLRSKS